LPKALNKLTQTHTKLECTLKKKKDFKIIPRGIILGILGMVADASVLVCESPSLVLNFCYPSLNLSCGYFPGKAHPG
jgi:hypothetical protein